MKTGKSDISQQEFPENELHKGSDVNHQVFSLIQKEFPDFKKNSLLSTDELNQYRKKYLSQLLKIEKREASKLEKEVIQSINDNEVLSHKIGKEQLPPLSYGQKIADKVAAFGGSWGFIICFFIFLGIWMGINMLILATGTQPFDPYPFILLNLLLSTLASIQAPIILMSQNRKETRDRQRAENDYKINLKAELEIRMLHEKVDHLILHQNQRLIDIQEIQTELLNDILKKMEKK